MASKREEEADVGTGSGDGEAEAKTETSTTTTSMTAKKFASGLPHVEPIEDLSPRVVRVLGMNPGPFTLMGTNTYLVGTGSSRLLVDTGEGRPEYAEALAKQLRDRDVTLKAVLITHHHYDHIGGIADVLKAVGKTVPVFKHTPAGDEGGYDVDFTDIADGQTFAVEGATLKAVFSPGHTVDHMSFFLEEESALFTGDCVLGCGSAVFENLRIYLSSLKTLAALGAEKLYPGHGPVVADGTAAITAYVTHRLAREQQVLAVLTSPDFADSGASPKQVAAVMYSKEGVPAHLMQAAARSVALHCQKLFEEGNLTAMGGSDEAVDKVWKLKTKDSAL